jgi:very-short-patch-repair endonuclease
MKGRVRSFLASARRQSKAEQYAAFLTQLRQLSIGWTGEHRFHPTRKWRLDFARPDIRLAIEIDGGVWTQGRHSGGQGQIDDMEKGNAAVAEGWQVLHFTPQQVRNGEAYRFVHYLHHRQIPDELKPTDTIKRKPRALEKKTA